MATTGGSVMLRAAIHLNDPSQLVYTNTVLNPFLNMALEELDEELAIFSLSVQRKTSIPILVDAGDKALPEMPTDFIEAVALHERARGSQLEWMEIPETRWIDENIKDSSFISQWASRGMSPILIAPANENREVLLEYIAGIKPVGFPGDNLDYANSARYLGLVTAKNAARDAGNSVTKAQSFEPDIIRARDRIVRRLQKEQQGMGTRRRAYGGLRY